MPQRRRDPQRALGIGPHIRHFRAAGRSPAIAFSIAAGLVALGLFILLPKAHASESGRLELAQAGTVPPPAPKAAARAKEEGTPRPAKAEATYMNKLDRMVAPLRDYALSADDAMKLAAAFKAVASGDLDKAEQLKGSMSDPVAQRLIEWERLRRGKGKAAEYLKFLAEHPDWPSRELLQRRMEESLFTEGGDTDVLATYFKDGAARSPAGMAVLASVHLAHGKNDKAKELASKIWREEDLPPGLEKGFLRRFGPMLTAADHKWRLDRLLIDDVRYKADRIERAARVKSLIPLLPETERKTAENRLAVFMREGDKTNLGNPDGGKGTDWGVVFHKIQKQRRAGKLDEAAKLMRTAPRDPLAVANLDEWWVERRSLAYLALKENKPKLAYELVQDAGPLGVNALNDQTFMAGWIALRYLSDPKSAEKHFSVLVSNADGPLTRARANYWMGRTAEVLGDKARAKKSYEAAARFKDTFHGLLAIQKLSPGTRALSFEAPTVPSPALVKRFSEHDAIKAVAIAEKAKLGRHISRVFLLNGAKIENDEAWAALAAHLARALGDTQTSVRIGKAAIARGHSLYYYSYPVHALPAYKPLRPPPEKAYLLGLARQETEFNSSTVSGAGARGILQVMKVTADHICRDYKIKCTHAKLLSDDSYNIMIASAYVADRLDDWNGSYVLGLPSYNAGPGRTRQWVREFGDPREAGIDPLDWIERIPIEETRNYVAKVLSNIQVYRARLGEASPLRLDEDLYRASASKPAHAAGAGKTSTAESAD